MKNLFIALCLIASACVPAFAQTNIDAMEYFFDSDPGLGNGTSIAITPGPVQDLNVSISTTALSVGFHTLVIRAKHQSGVWGVQDSRVVYVAPQTVSADAIVGQVEYYIDSDPGPGNGVNIPIFTSFPTSVDLFPAIPTTSLAPGFHVIHIRARDGDGSWGIPDSRPFYVVAGDVSTQADIIQLEYFFDTEPGYGAGTPLAVTSGTTINLPALVSTTSLSNGFHTISVRAKDNNGQWGFAETRTFYVDQFNQISAVEYYIDTDPGEGSATTVSITPGGAVDQNFTVATTSIPSGSHTIGVRAARTDGSWGNTTTSTFTIKEVQTITFSALATVTVGDAPFTLAGTTSSGLSLSYTSSNPLVATISGSTVTIVGAGSTVITASQTGDTNFAAATDVTRTLVVLPAPVNNIPALTGQPGTAFYISGPVVVNNSVIITDADNTLASAMVSITSGFQSAEDQLLFTTQNGLTGSYNTTTGVLTISGAGSVANYQTALRSVQYNNTAPVPNTSDRTISLQVNDGATVSNAVITVITINKPPVIEAPAKDTQAGGNIAFLVNDIFSDPDNNLDFATLTIVSAQGANVTISNGIITVNYNNVPDYEGTDQLTITICDQGGKCQTQIVSVDVSADIDVFNGISANADGMNDYLRIKFLPTGSHVVIINRWGDTVFESDEYDNNDPAKRFEGNSTDGNAITSGTYFYKITIPGKREYTGYLHLKR